MHPPNRRIFRLLIYAASFFTSVPILMSNMGFVQKHNCPVYVGIWHWTLKYLYKLLRVHHYESYSFFVPSSLSAMLQMIPICPFLFYWFQQTFSDNSSQYIHHYNHSQYPILFHRKFLSSDNSYSLLKPDILQFISYKLNTGILNIYCLQLLSPFF
jgi:hypothetical protein